MSDDDLAGPRDMTDDVTDDPDAGLPADPRLTDLILEVERHVDENGWDADPMLFALVDTAEILRSDPETAAALGVDPLTPFTPVEQDELPEGDLDDVLAQIAWGDEVAGCVLSQEVVMLPPEVEANEPEGTEDEIAIWASNHPDRREVRLVVGVLRDGATLTALRFRDEPDHVSVGVDLAPGLSEALLATFEEDDED